jgi:hypothetical protein
VSRHARPLLVAIALVTLLLTACGGGGMPTMSDDAASRVQSQVTAVRNAVAARDADGAARALATLRSTVEHLRRSGDVSAAKASEIVAAATDVQAQLVAITTTTTTTTTRPPAPPTKPAKGPKGDEGEHGNGHD